MKNRITYTLFLLFSFCITNAQVCTNFDFEAGAFAPWTGAKGVNNISSLGPLSNIVPGLFSNGIDAPRTDSSARHTIVTSASGNDSCSGIPCVYPGGQYSVRLGGTTSAYQGQYIEQTFTVNDTAVMAHFALVLVVSGHSAADAPYFKIEAFDNSSNLIPGSTLYLTDFDSASGITCQPHVFYWPWTTHTINLASYINTSVKLRFTVAGCIYGGHWAYAYVDATCPNLTLSMAENMHRQMQLKPNPAAEKFTITLPEVFKKQKRLQLIIYDSQGKEILQSTVPEAENGMLTVDSESWAKGFYTVVLKNDEVLLREKLIKN